MFSLPTKRGHATQRKREVWPIQMGNLPWPPSPSWEPCSGPPWCLKLPQPEPCPSGLGCHCLIAHHVSLPLGSIREGLHLVFQHYPSYSKTNYHGRVSAKAMNAQFMLHSRKHNREKSDISFHLFQGGHLNSPDTCEGHFNAIDLKEISALSLKTGKTLTSFTKFPSILQE